MEVRVQSADGYDVPPGCFVGVRVGDVLKQGRYEPSRSYHFPGLDRRRNAKIDIYRHVGSCIIALDPEATSTHEVKVSHTDPTTPAMKLKVNVAASNAAAAGKKREARTKAVKHQAQDYLTKFNIEEKLSEAVKALLKEQPQDPTAFLCRHLVENANNLPASPVSGGQVKVPGQSQISPSTGVAPQSSLKPFRGYYAANCLPGPTPECSANLYAKFPAAAERLKPKVPAPATASAPTKPATSSVARPSKSSEMDEEELAALRNKAREVLVKASSDGGLVAALQDVRTVQPNFALRPSVGTWFAKRQVPWCRCDMDKLDGSVQVPASPAFNKMASVGSWLSPRPPADP